MEYEGRGRGLEGFAPLGRFAPEPSFVDQRAKYLAEYRDPSRALAFLRELGLKVAQESLVLMPVLVSLVKHDTAVVVRQCIVSGTGFFCAVLEEIAQQIHSSGMIERWLEEIWQWMLKFKDALRSVVTEHGSVGARALAVKFIEVYILLFSSANIDSDKVFTEGNISRLIGSHPILESGLVTFEVEQSLEFLSNLLKFAGTFPGSLIIVIINCLANIARKRPVHYNSILSSLIAFNPDFNITRVVHAGSVRYALRTAFFGFLRCMNHHPSIADSREKLLWVLRSMSPGESTEQIIRQAEKMSKSMERIARDSRLTKEEITLKQLSSSGDLLANKVIPDIDSSRFIEEASCKRVLYDHASNSVYPGMVTDPPDNTDMNLDDGVSSNGFILDTNVSAVEQMIGMIEVMIAQGEKGAGPLELLISKIQPELLADMVIINMRHLPCSPLPWVSKVGDKLDSSQVILSTTTSSIMPTAVDITNFHTSGMHSQPVSAVNTVGIADIKSDTSLSNLVVDSRRDPRRDPRRLDPRRPVAPAVSDHITSYIDNLNDHSKLEIAKNKPVASEIAAPVKLPSLSKAEENKEPFDVILASTSSKISPREGSTELSMHSEMGLSSDNLMSVDSTALPILVDRDMHECTPFRVGTSEVADADTGVEPDQLHQAVSEQSFDLPSVPPYVDLSDELIKLLGNIATLKVIEVYKQVPSLDCAHVCLSLIPILVAQRSNINEIIVLLQKHILVDYQHHKGYELVLHVLYYTHAMMVCEEHDSFASIIYEEFLLIVAKFLRDTFPASDKAFSRLLGEVPFLPDSVLKLLEDLCQTPTLDHNGKDAFEADRVTQGLGTVWSLILVRPNVRQACLNIALECTVHAQDEVRTKAIRLVANKLFVLSYISETIEQFAQNKLLSLVDKDVQDVEVAPQDSSEHRMDFQPSSQDTSTSSFSNLESACTETGSKVPQSTVCSITNLSLSQAQRYASLFFALCTKKPSLLQVLFDIYGKSPKAVKQSIHRHIPALIRNMGPSFHDLLRIISNPSDGSENLLMLVLQILTEEMTPSTDLISTIKHLYETKLKDAAILIPLLSSLSKNEVLPIFPKLVDLPMEKFQPALARILEGSAHTGPALTPVEVLVAIHDINPERDGVPLKKIMDACRACFEQRTVFTQQVLAKSLNLLVDRTPLPLLFMRTVIQAIDAFPTLVDFVMEILSKLVNKQIWKMPKFWVGFLKCASQTHPHSFPVLLQLPAPQLEFVLSKHPTLRAPLFAHASQPHIKSSLPRPILATLGLVAESQQQPRQVVPS